MSGEMRPRDIALLELRLARLELSLLEVVTAVGMLVGELGLRGDLVLTTPKAVEEALEHGWQTLIGLPDQDAPGLVVDARFADRRRLAAAAPDALAGAVEATGAAVGALYTVEGNGLKLAASVGYPDGVMDEYAQFGGEADLPAATAGPTHRALWFGTREQIVETYPHLRKAHERTEVALGED